MMARILPPVLAGVLVTALALTLVLTLALPRQAAASTEPVSMACVDSNGNGVIDRAEAIVVLRQYLSGDTELGSLACADSNGNGAIDRAEAIVVLRQYLSGELIPGRYDHNISDPELTRFIRWEIQDSVSQWEAESVVQGIRLTYQFAKKIGVPDPNEPFVVYVDNDIDRLSEWYANRTGRDFESSRRDWEDWTSISRMGLIVIKTSTPDNEVWTQGEGLNELTTRTMRRYIQTAMQFGVAGLETDPGGFRQHVRVDTPLWLTIGVTGLLTDMVIQDYYNRLWPRTGSREPKISRASTITGVTLEDAEIWPSDQVARDRTEAIRYCIDNCGYPAAELLASRVGIAGLSRYYMLLEPEMFPLRVSEADFPRPDWRTAFEQAFGMTTEDFYQLYEEHKAAGFPEVEIPIPGRYDHNISDPELTRFIRWEIQDSVSQWEAESVVQGIELAYQFAQKTGVPDPNETIVVYVDNDVDRLSKRNQVRRDAEDSRRFWENRITIPWPGRIIIKTSTPDNEVWTQDEGLNELTRQVVRQYINNGMQIGVAGQETDAGGFIPSRSFLEPQWLTRGMLGLLTEMVVLDHDGIEYPQRQNREWFVSNAAAITGVTLEDTEIWPTGYDSEDEAVRNRARAIIKCIGWCGYLASELLASREGVAGLSRYYMHLEPEMIPHGVDEADFPRPGWRTAFEEAFGMTTEQFYQLYEEHKADGFPEVTIPEPE